MSSPTRRGTKPDGMFSLSSMGVILSRWARNQVLTKPPASDEPNKWVTELQEPVAPAAGSVRDESRLDSSS
jgi:hypothetical protein